jgi:hypothetical protein
MAFRKTSKNVNSLAKQAFPIKRAVGLQPSPQGISVHDKIGKNTAKIANFGGKKTACTVFAPTCKLQHLYAMLSVLLSFAITKTFNLTHCKNVKYQLVKVWPQLSMMPLA